MHEGVTPIEDNETPCNTCMDYEGVRKGTKNMVNGKVTKVTLSNVRS